MKKFIAVLGIVYLCAEFGFNAHLLDVISGIHTKLDIHHIEWAGKIVSSAGLWIILLKLLSMLGKKWSWAANAIMAVVLAAVAGFAMVSVQDGIATALADNASGQERKAAVLIQTTMGDVIQGNVNVQGFDFSRQDLKTPEGMTFVALLPAFSIANPNAAAIYAKPAELSLENQVLMAENQVFDPYWNRYKALSNHVRNLYNNQYQCQSAKLEASSGEAAWGSYLDEVGTRFNIHETPSLALQARIINQVRERGVNVPDDWLPDDKDGFIKAYNGSVNDTKAQGAFMEKSHGLPPGLGWSEFSSHPVVQAEIKKNLESFDIKGNLSLDLNQAEFRNRFIRSSSRAEINKKLAVIRSDSADFEDEHRLAEVGREAVKSVKVPVISLAFSCVFAIVNLLMLLISASPTRKIKLVIATTSLMILMAPLLISNKISSSGTFKDVIKSMPRQLAMPALWVTNAQPYVYPVGHFFLIKLNLEPRLKTNLNTIQRASFNFESIPECNTNHDRQAEGA